MFDEARANPQIEFDFGAGEGNNRRVGNISTTGNKAGYDCSHLIHSAGGTCADNDANHNGIPSEARTVAMVNSNDYSIQDSLKADCRTITGFTISGQGDAKFNLTHDINGKSMQIQKVDGTQWSGDLKLSCPRGNPNNSSDYHLTTTACWHYDIQSVDPRHPGQARPQAQAGSNANSKCAAMPSAGTAQGHPCGGATCGACPTDSPTPTPSYAPSWHTERPTPAPSAQYQYSDLGSNSCPSGCSAINDLQTCKNTLSDAQSMNPAASQLGGNTAGTGSGGNYGSGRPGGCFLHNPNKHIHFNTDSTGGNSHGDDYKICKC
jgi:hypothetical protein